MAPDFSDPQPIQTLDAFMFPLVSGPFGSIRVGVNPLDGGYRMYIFACGTRKWFHICSTALALAVPNHDWLVCRGAASEFFPDDWRQMADLTRQFEALLGA